MPTDLPPRATQTHSGIRRRPGRVLILDDEVILAGALRDLLSDENEIVVESRAEAALVRLRRGEHYDVVLCDVMMPNMSGVELHARLSLSHPEVAARMVFMSGGYFGSHIESYLARVPNLVLQKPFDIGGLRALIERRVTGDGELHAAAGA
jgi:CheY-like chemotaxis protein